MKKFLDDNFILETETAKHLFFDYAKDLPIIDYHCHINPKDIYDDTKYDNITQIWLYGDHYKWRIMRATGIDEKYITGDGTDYEKFLAFAKALEKSIGNPLYHWSHMELKKYFKYDGILNSRNAKEVWDYLNEYIKKNGMSARKIIEASNVEVICTTDDPIDDLKYHDLLGLDNTFNVKVYPAFRPDKVVNISKDTFIPYIDSLSKATNIKIESLKDLEKALRFRMDFFDSKGCKISDHGLDFIPYVDTYEGEVEKILKDKLNGDALSDSECEKYMTYILCFFGREYKKRDWVMQLHYNCLRNANDLMFNKLGPDTGFDVISSRSESDKLAKFLNMLNINNGLTKTIIYSLNPNDNDIIGSIIGAFQGESLGKIQHGSSWWFNDNKLGMEKQLKSVSNLGVLGNFIGMLTDSRSFLSYTRHEYFRRIMCNYVGSLVENGEYPNDEEALKEIVCGISYYNAKQYFNFK